MILEILISTFGKNGLDRVKQMYLPEIDNVSYLVSLQNPYKEEILYPEVLKRSDIRIIETDSIGLGLNRNHSLLNATGDILLIADDDLVYKRDGIIKIKELFESNDDLDFATFQYAGGDNKIYPEYSFNLKTEPRGYYITSFEIAIRRESLPLDIQFSRYIGAGMNLFGSGEENLFVYRLIQAGLKGMFYPIEIVRHPALTTGSRESTPAMLRGQGNWFRLRYGIFMGYLRLIRDVPRRNTSWYKSYLYMTQGFILSFFYFKRNGEDK